MESKLETYIDSYMSHLPKMLENHEGKWTVIGEGLKPSSFWNTRENALKEGIRVYGDSIFLLRQVSNDYVEYGKYGKPRVINYENSIAA